MTIDRRRASTERRSARRAPFVAAVRQRSGGETALALAQDLGETGIKLRRLGPPSAGGPVTLEFELPDGGELVRVRGAVVFERAEGRFSSAGVRFEAISGEDRARIARYLDLRLR